MIYTACVWAFWWWLSGLVILYAAGLVMDWYEGGNPWPSPRAIAKSLGMACIGPLFLIVLLLVFIDWAKDQVRYKTWWTTPLNELWKKKRHPAYIKAKSIKPN